MDRAVFVAVERTLWDIRQATKCALRYGRIPNAYTIERSFDVLPGVIDTKLESIRTSTDLAQKWGEYIEGEANGVLRCVALRVAGQGESVLIHRSGQGVRMAYLPALSEVQAIAEHKAAVKLALLADRVSNMQILLPQAFDSGRHLLRDLLLTISEAIDV